MITLLGYNTTYLEIFASIISFTAVVLATRAKVWNWPVGIIGQILFYIIFLRNELFGQMTLQVFFTAVSIYGWYYWKRDSGKKIKTLNLKQILLSSTVTIILCLIGAFILGFFQTKYVLLDASTTVISMVAVYGLSKKYLNAWILWIIVDILSVILFHLKGINLLAFEYVLITCVATYGLINWIKLYNRQDDKRISTR